MKFSSHIVTTVLMLIFPAIALRAQTINEYNLNVKDFNRLKVAGGVNVEYRCVPDSAGMVHFTTTADKAPMLLFSNPKGTLVIETSKDAKDVTLLPRVRVYSSFLTGVENSGDSTVRVIDAPECNRFEATVVGNGHLVVKGLRASKASVGLLTGHGLIKVDGTCKSASIKLVGTGVIEADGLEATDVSVKASGTGTIGVFATGRLSVFGLGTNTVYYKGNPQIQRHSAGIKIEQITQ